MTDTIQPRNTPLRSSREFLPRIAPARFGSSTWLLLLRWFAVAGQLLTILTAGSLSEVELPYSPLLGLVALTAVTNTLYGVWLYTLKPFDTPNHGNVDGSVEIQTDWQRDTEAKKLQSVALTLMLLDLITLTAMLYFSGGAGNPFSFFYFVNLAVGGVMIRPKAAWSLTVTAIAGYTFLLNDSIPVTGLDIFKPHGFDLQTGGLMLAFATCSSVVTYFVTQTAGELKQRERQLLRSQAEQAASQRLEGLTTLAAGAAHELATPLSTIDVVVRELSRHLEGWEKPESVDTDLKLIDGELEMCRQILQRMRSAAGDSMAQRWDRTTVGDLIDQTLEGVRDPHRVDVTDGTAAVEGQALWVPQEAVAQAVRNLIHNGLDASGEMGRVRVEPQLIAEHLQISVMDSGQGMSQEVLGRASDPFFTTKEPGRGIGLGLFLTRNVISQLGGRLEFRSALGQGTEAVVTIPLGKQKKPTGQPE
ncbi:ATP-binding protein [bacterium]|nr:ATP-binding protein [bacterium]MDA7936822.1 ATP-binding protein [bacterium]MDB4353121.1 ATP-binding protein [bacterium]